MIIFGLVVTTQEHTLTSETSCQNRIGEIG